MRRRVFTKSPVRENCTPGSVRGLSGNWQSYRDLGAELFPGCELGAIVKLVRFCRQVNRKLRALVQLAFKRHLAAVSLHDLFNQREAQACADDT